MFFCHGIHQHMKKEKENKQQFLQRLSFFVSLISLNNARFSRNESKNKQGKGKQVTTSAMTILFLFQISSKNARFSRNGLRND
jgi:hypothetical protein